MPKTWETVHHFMGHMSVTDMSVGLCMSVKTMWTMVKAGVKL